MACYFSSVCFCSSSVGGTLKLVEGCETSEKVGQWKEKSGSNTRTRADVPVIAACRRQGDCDHRPKAHIYEYYYLYMVNSKPNILICQHFYRSGLPISENFWCVAIFQKLNLNYFKSGTILFLLIFAKLASKALKINFK